MPAYCQAISTPLAPPQSTQGGAHRHTLVYTNAHFSFLASQQLLKGMQMITDCCGCSPPCLVIDPPTTNTLHLFKIVPLPWIPEGNVSIS